MASLRELRPAITEYARTTGASFDYNHDYEHHIRFVARDAERLARAEGAHEDVCWTAAMLHELGLVGGREGHDGRTPGMAESFLRSRDANAAEAISVVKVLHGYHTHNVLQHPTREEKCVHDANERHAVGPNGFLRVFSDMIHVLDKLPRREAMQKLPEYLERRPDLFQTRTGRKMAEQDMPLLREFIRRYRAYEEL